MKLMQRVLLLLLLLPASWVSLQCETCLITRLTSFSPSQATPMYNVEIEKFEHLPGEQETLIDFRDIRIIGRERALNGTMSILENMDDEHFQVSVDFQTDPLNNGYWRNMVFSVPSLPICFAYTTFIAPYAKTTMLQGLNTNMPFDGKQCPLPKGTYYLNRLLMSTDTWPRIMPHGGLRSTFRYFKNGNLIGGCRCSTLITRKLSTN